MNKSKKLYEGKAKIIYSTSEKNLVVNSDSSHQIFNQEF